MSKFKLNNYKITAEPDRVGEVRVKNVDQDQNPEVKDFDFQVFKKSEHSDYKTVKSKYGPLAITDVERTARSQKDRRFSLNPLLKEPLSVDQEEQRILEDKIKSNIQSIAQEAKVQAITAGYQEGLKKGYEEAFKQVKTEGLASVQKFDQLVIEMEGAKDAIFQANEKALVEIVYRIAKMVLLKELSLDREYVLRLVKELVSRVGLHENITLRINPEDSKLSDSLREGLEKTYGAMKNLNIESSKHVSRGGCEVETEWNTIEGNVENQLESIYDALMGTKGS